MLIAIDGDTASGKGTLAKRLAAHFSLFHLDTGLLYRAVGKAVLDGAEDPAAAAQELDLAAIDEASLRNDAVAGAASKAAAIPEVRAALLDQQRSLATDWPEGFDGAVLDGRDIGTVIFPDARHKFYITASDEVRAERRLAELQNRGQSATYETVLQDLRNRDDRDRNRAAAPMKIADDAYVIDTGRMTADEVFGAAVQFILRT